MSPTVGTFLPPGSGLLKRRRPLHVTTPPPPPQRFSFRAADWEECGVKTSSVLGGLQSYIRETEKLSAVCDEKKTFKWADNEHGDQIEATMNLMC